LLSCSASSCLHALLKSVTPLHCHREGCDVNRTLKLPFSCLTNLRSPNKLENIGLHSLLKFIFLSFSISSHCRFIPEELCHLTKPHLPVIPPTTPPAPPQTHPRILNLPLRFTLTLFFQIYSSPSSVAFVRLHLSPPLSDLHNFAYYGRHHHFPRRYRCGHDTLSISSQSASNLHLTFLWHTPQSLFQPITHIPPGEDPKFSPPRQPAPDKLQLHNYTSSPPVA
jgi:hypothetical protein